MRQGKARQGVKHSKMGGLGEITHGEGYCNKLV